jgi:hypothetical protein
MDLNDSNSENETKNMIKGFINVDSTPLNDNHNEVLKNTAFDGCSPRISDQVFHLEKYVNEPTVKIRSTVTTAVESTGSHEVTPTSESFEAYKSQMRRKVSEAGNGGLFDFRSYTVVEFSLLCLNILIFLSIVSVLLFIIVVILSINL